MGSIPPRWNPWSWDGPASCSTVRLQRSSLRSGVISSLLSTLNWSSLQVHQKAVHLTLLYKLVNKHIAVDSSHLLKTPVNNTRSNTSTDPAVNISTSKDCNKCSFSISWLYRPLQKMVTGPPGQLFSTDTLPLLSNASHLIVEFAFRFRFCI